MEIVDIDSRLFAYKRKNGNEEILVVNNLSNEEVIINNEERLLEIVLNEIEKNDVIILKPYQMKWLKKIGL